MSKEYKNIDDLFRDKFEDYEVDPPEHIWVNVKAGISGNAGKGSGLNLKNGGIAGITLLLISLGIIGFYLINNSFVFPENTQGAGMTTNEALDQGLFAANRAEESTANENNDFQDHLAMQPSSAAPVSSPGPVAGTPATSEKEKKDKKAKVRATNPKRNASLVIDPKLSAAIPTHKVARIGLNVNSLATAPIGIPENRPEPIAVSPVSTSTTETGPAETTALVHTDDTGPDMVRGQSDPPAETGKAKNKRNDYGQVSRWAMGVYFTPEMIVYPSDDQLKNYSYSLDLLATYKPGKYFLQSGLGLARNHDQGNTQVNYNKYLGSYEDVYNVTFDTTNGGVVPIYHTETVSIYDSINHVIITPSKRYFTYLQLPLFVGYGEESKRFGWFVKGGPSISFLVHEDIPSSGLNGMDARVLNVENELPGRISTNWQFILAAGATYKLGPRLSISVEPMFRYYIKSVYEQDKLNTKHPYSVGLRTGFLLNF